MPGEVNDIHNYYETCAKDYNSLRFGNSYGSFVHNQERKILLKELDATLKNRTLDLCCGTGRFMEFAAYGIDLSEQMIAEALKDHPTKSFHVADAEQIPFNDKYFSQIFCMHALMHLTKDKTVRVLNEANRVLVKGGKLIIDFPSKKRRNIFKRKRDGWHGSNDYLIKEIKDVIGGDWNLKTYNGILFLPIHRFPNWIRKYIIAVDSGLCNSILKEYSSYLVVTLEKK